MPPLQVVAASPTDYRMYYHSWDAARRRYVVGFATSSDALRWRKQGAVFEGGTGGGAFDSGGALNVHVVKDGDLQRCTPHPPDTHSSGRSFHRR